MDRFKSLVDEACSVIAEEASGRFRVPSRNGMLVTLDLSPTVVVGDLHGDLSALTEILECSGISGRLDRGWRIAFLGDYGDRGPDSLGVYEAILELKVRYPSGVLLLKGNHEALDLIRFQPHDLPDQARARYGSRWFEVYGSILKLHSMLPSAAIYGDHALLVHGGIFKGLSRGALESPKREELEAMLWSDPTEDFEGIAASPRGAGARFGPAVTHEALRKLGVGMVVRSHSMVPSGYRFNHGGRVLTIFSAKYVYGLETGAYLVLGDGRAVAEGIELF